MKTAYTEGDARAVISGFAAVFDQEEFRIRLDRLARDRWLWGSVQEVRVQPLKAHQRRCTFEVAAKALTGWHSLIGKVHTVDRSDIFQAMAALARGGFAPQAEFSIPQPLVYLSELRVLLEEKVPGPSAKEIFLNGSSYEQAAVAERSARWLACFHDAAPPFGKVAGSGAQIELCRRWAGEIASFGEPLAAKCERLIRRFEAVAPASGTNGFRAGHGSYMPEHVILSGERTTTIDLDEYDVADPARDLAWFVVSLQRLALQHLGSLHSLDDPVQHFVETYAAAGPAGATAHLPFYRAAECLHRARRDLFKRVSPVREWAEIMLDEGLRLVAP